MKIAVTGANGFLGTGIVRELLDRGHEVVAVGRSTDRIDDRAICLKRDVFQFRDPYEEMRQPDCVLHLAWRDGFKHNSPAHLEDLKHHADFLGKLFDSPTTKICVMGSMHEVGFFEGSVKADTPCNPQSMYGIAKNALRQITQFYSSRYNKPFQWLRGFYIVDRSPSGDSIFSKISKAARKGEKSFPFTTGENLFDFLDYEEFCSQVADVVLQNTVLGVINICSGRPESLSNRVERFIKENGFEIQLDYGVFPNRPYDSKAIWGDSTLIDLIKANK